MKKKKIECRRCRQWQDESMEESLQHSAVDDPPVFYGCRLHGTVPQLQLDSCPDFQVSEDLFSLCRTCGIPAPKICLLWGECLNCTDTDYYCVLRCDGKEERVFCTHYQRLRQTGYTLLEDHQAYDIYPETDPSQTSDPPPPLIDRDDDFDENE